MRLILRLVRDGTVRKLLKIAGEPVSRILCATILQSRRGDHSSRPWFAPRLQQPTRGFATIAACLPKRKLAAR